MTTALEGVRGQRHVPAALYLRERPGTHCTGGWVGPRAGLDRCGKSRPHPGFDPPDRPARSQSLYRLSYPTHMHNTYQHIIPKGKGSNCIWNRRRSVNYTRELLFFIQNSSIAECNISGTALPAVA